MSAFERAIELAKHQLPAAFAVGSSLPYSDGAAPRTVLPQGGEGLVAGNVPADEATIPTGTEDIPDFEGAFNELGFEAIAFYRSFHCPTPEGWWGIFYFDHRVRQFAELVRSEFHITPNEAARLALRIVRAHEHFHFRFDAYALYHELILGKPLYNEYSRSVYAAVYCTSDCLEEALANRSCLESEHARRFFGLRIYNTHQVKPFLRNLFAKAPPGYRDYGKPLDELCSGLGGQLFEAKPSARLPKPQSDWVCRAFRRGHCPEYFLHSDLGTNGKAPEFTLKRGGYKWRVHKSDPDHWPSKPHAHDYDGNVKLDIKDGTVYDVTTKKPIDKVKRGDLVELRNEITRRFPGTPLDPLMA